MSEKCLSWGPGSILELERGQNDEMLSRVHPSPSTGPGRTSLACLLALVVICRKAKYQKNKNTTSGRSLGAVVSAKMDQDYQERLY